MFPAKQDMRVTTAKLYKVFGYAEHRNLKEIVLKNISSFEKFGDVRVVYDSPQTSAGGRPSSSYALNLDQCLMLVGLVRGREKSNKISILEGLVAAYSNASLVGVLDLISSLDVDDLQADRYVYVAREEFSGRFKIGISKDPAKRIVSLNIGNPEKLTLVHAYLATEDGYKSEALAHKLYESERIRSEWFTSSIDLNLLPSYRASCAQTGDCDCKDCAMFGEAYEIIGEMPPSSRDEFISALCSNGFSFDDAARVVDADSELGVINIIGKSHVQDLRLEAKQ